MSDFNYMSSIIEKIVVARSKTVDRAILGEIQQIAVENGLETKIILNEKNVLDALRNYQEGYARIKAEAKREVLDEFEEILCGEFLTERFWFDLGKLRIKYMEVKK